MEFPDPGRFIPVDATPEQIRRAALIEALTCLANACSHLHGDPNPHGDPTDNECEALIRLTNHYYDQFDYGEPMLTLLRAYELIEAELAHCFPNQKV